VLVQTRLPRHEVLAAAVAGNPSLLDDQALRRELALPPAAALALVKGDGADAFAATLVEAEVADLGDGRWLVRAADHQALCDALARTPRPAGRVQITVDPTDI